MDVLSQKAFFESFGYLFVRGLFSKREIEDITLEAEDLWLEERGGANLGDTGQSVAPFVEKRASLTALMDDERIYTVLEAILGEGFVWAGSEGNITVSGEHLWHPDRPGDNEEISYDRIKVNVYLDPVDLAHGCLRVIPGSHRQPLHESIEPEYRHQRGVTVYPYAVDGPDMPSVPFESEPGDVVFFHQSLWHAVFNGWPNRRYIALKYAAKPKTDNQIASLVYYSKNDVLNVPESILNSDRLSLRNMVCNLQEYVNKSVPDFVPFRED